MTIEKAVEIRQLIKEEGSGLVVTEEDISCAGLKANDLHEMSMEQASALTTHVFETAFEKVVSIECLLAEPSDLMWTGMVNGYSWEILFQGDDWIIDFDIEEVGETEGL
ncbi:MAG: hypothetical protein AB8B36_05955 [Prochlorococcus sp.]